MSDQITTEQNAGEEPAASSSDIEQQIKLAEAKKAASEAELKVAKQAAKDKRAESRTAVKNRIKQLGFKKTLQAIAIGAVAAILVFTVVIPLLREPPQNVYFSESDLEKVVNIDKLSTIDYAYWGIAEKPDLFGPIYIKYEAHIRVAFDMSKIRFEVNEPAKTVHVFLPDPTIEAPQFNAEEFDFIPDNAQADIAEVIHVCSDDAAAETAESTAIAEKAYENLESTIRALTLPLIGDYELEFHLPESREEVPDDVE